MSFFGRPRKTLASRLRDIRRSSRYSNESTMRSSARPPRSRELRIVRSTLCSARRARSLRACGGDELPRDRELQKRTSMPRDCTLRTSHSSEAGDVGSMARPSRRRKDTEGSRPNILRHIDQPRAAPAGRSEAGEGRARSARAVDRLRRALQCDGVVVGFSSR